MLITGLISEFVYHESKTLHSTELIERRDGTEQVLFMLDNEGPGAEHCKYRTRCSAQH